MISPNDGERLLNVLINKMLNSNFKNYKEWDKNLIVTLDKAIRESDLGLNPQTTDESIRIPLPPLTEERRKDLIKIVKQEGEQSKISIRNIRRDSLTDIKELLTEKIIGEDDERKGQSEIQLLTDRYVDEVDKNIASKEEDLMII